MIWDAYYTLNKTEWRTTNNAEYRRAVERRFRSYFLKYREFWDSMEPHMRMQISDGVRNRAISEGMVSEAKTPNQWLRDVAGDRKKRKKRK